MIPIAVLNSIVSIKRRVSLGRDSLNNPDYGTPTTGDGWNTIYQGMSVKLAFNSKVARFAQEGERIQPAGVMYFNSGPKIQPEDRVLTAEGIEYNVISVVPSYTMGNVVDHFEAILQLP